MQRLQPGKRAQITLSPIQGVGVVGEIVTFTGVIICSEIVGTHDREMYRVGDDQDGKPFMVTAKRILDGTLMSLGMCAREELLTHKCLEVRQLATIPIER